MAWGAILLWHGLLAIRPATLGLSSSESSPVASSWTIIASQNILAENLALVRQDQGLLAAVFLVLVPLVSSLNFVALPFFLSPMGHR
jgi:hypothetical protein